MKARTSIVCALLAASCAAAPVSAGPYLLRYTGQITAGIDAIGLFGASGQDLAGQDFALDFKLWRPFPAAVDGVFVDGGSFYQTLTSGQLVNAPPALSAVVTIAGQSYYVSRAYFARAAFQDNFYADDDGNVIDSVSTFAYGNDSATIVSSAIGNMAATMLRSPSLTERNRYAAAPGDIRTGYFRTLETRGGAGLATDLTLLPMTFQSGPFPGTPGVPEPSAWTMLLAGFAAIGGLVRRRRRLRPEPAPA